MDKTEWMDMASMRLASQTRIIFLAMTILVEGSSAWPAYRQDQKAAGVELPHLSLVRFITTEAYPGNIVWSPSGSSLAAYLTRGQTKVVVWNDKSIITNEILLSTTWPPGKRMAFITDTKIVTPPTTEDSTAALSVTTLGVDQSIEDIAGREKGAAGRGERANTVVLSPDRSQIAGAFSYGVNLFSAGSLKAVDALLLQSGGMQVSALAYSADGKLLAVSMGNSLLIVRRSDLSVIQTIEAFSGDKKECCISSIAFNPLGNEIAVSSDATFNGPCRPTWTFPHDACVDFQSLSLIRIFDPITGNQTTSFSGPVWPILNLIWSPKGYLVFLSKDGIHFWEPATNSKSFFPLNPGSVSMALSPDGVNLAVCISRDIEVFSLD